MPSYSALVRSVEYLLFVLRSVEVTPDGLLVPLQADPRPFRHEGVPVLDPDRLLEDRARVVEVLQPVGSRTDGQQVGTYLWEYMARERETRGFGQSGGSEPAGDAPDLHCVEHPVVAGPRLEALGYIVRAPPVLADADRGTRLLGDPGVSGEVVGAGGLLDPVEVLLVEYAHPLDRPRHRERLVVVHREPRVTDHAAHGRLSWHRCQSTGFAPLLRVAPERQ